MFLVTQPFKLKAFHPCRFKWEMGGQGELCLPVEKDVLSCLSVMSFTTINLIGATLLMPNHLHYTF